MWNTEPVLQPPAYPLFYHEVARSLETACHYAFSNYEIRSQPLHWKRQELRNFALHKFRWPKHILWILIALNILLILVKCRPVYNNYLTKRKRMFLNFSPCFFTASSLVEYTMATFTIFRNLHIIFATKDSHLQRRGCVQMLHLTSKDLFQTVIYSRPIQTTADVHMIRQPLHE